MLVATCEIMLPPAPVQILPQASRLVTVIGSRADGTTPVEVGFIGPVVIKAQPGATVSVEVVEVSSNGKQSASAPFGFLPQDNVIPNAADPTRFSVKVLSIEEVPEVVA